MRANVKPDLGIVWSMKYTIARLTCIALATSAIGYFVAAVITFVIVSPN